MFSATTSAKHWLNMRYSQQHSAQRQHKERFCVRYNTHSVQAYCCGGTPTPEFGFVLKKCVCVCVCLFTSVPQTCSRCHGYHQEGSPRRRLRGPLRGQEVSRPIRNQECDRLRDDNETYVGDRDMGSMLLEPLGFQQGLRLLYMIGRITYYLDYYY